MQNIEYQSKINLFGGLFFVESYSTEFVCDNCRILLKKGMSVENKKSLITVDYQGFSLIFIFDW